VTNNRAGGDNTARTDHRKLWRMMDLYMIGTCVAIFLTIAIAATLITYVWERMGK